LECGCGKFSRFSMFSGRRLKWSSTFLRKISAPPEKILAMPMMERQFVIKFHSLSLLFSIPSYLVIEGATARYYTITFRPPTKRNNKNCISNAVITNVSRSAEIMRLEPNVNHHVITRPPVDALCISCRRSVCPEF